MQTTHTHTHWGRLLLLLLLLLAAAHFAKVMPVASTLLTVGFCGG
jgi:hypothetical protein